MNRADLPLLLDRPNTATLAAHDDLDLRHTSALTTNRMGALSGLHYAFKTLAYTMINLRHYFRV